MALSSLLEPVSFLPTMPYRSKTNPSFTKQSHVFRYPLFTKYNQQRTRTCLFQSVQKPRSLTTCHLDLKPGCLEFKNKNPNHVQTFFQRASESTEQLKKLFISVVIGAIPIFYTYGALAASGGVMGGDCFSSHSSSSSSYSGSSSSSKSSSSSSSSSPSYSSKSSSSSPSSSSSSKSSSSKSYSSSSSSPYSTSRSSSDDSYPYSRSSYRYRGSESSELDPSVTSSESKYTMSTSVAPQPISPEERLIWISVVLSLSLVFIASTAIRWHKHNVYEEKSGKTSVIKLQVALLGSDRSFQGDLNQIAEQSNTSTQKGLKSILTESSLALLHHSASCVSSHLSISEEQSVQNGEKCFKRLSFEERGKFDQETLVNLDTFKKKQKLRIEFDDTDHDFIVVTFLIAAMEILKLRSIKSTEDLTTVVQKLESIPEKKILAVQVLWTPQNENDTLSYQRVLKDYPLLRPLDD